MAKKLTPMMQQFYEIKEQYQDCILFFRLGDFYEMFGDDAVVGAEILDITLTSRDKGEDALPMCGIPYHSAEGYIQKLTFAGKKVAICEQVSDPTLPGIVKREVIRVVTPGTNLNSQYLQQSMANRILAVKASKKMLGISFADLSTGEWLIDALPSDQFTDLIERIRPAEMLLNKEFYEQPDIYRLIEQKQILVTTIDDVREPEKNLCAQLNIQNLAVLELDQHADQVQLQAAANILHYLQETQKTDLIHFKKLKRLNQDRFLQLDATTIHNLELFYTQRDRQKVGSLYAAINRTKTTAGARKLAQWMVHPEHNLDTINKRLDHVAKLRTGITSTKKLQALLAQTADLQRVVARLALNQGSPRDLVAIRQTLTIVPEIIPLLDSLVEIANKMPNLSELKQFLIEAISENPPAVPTELGIIADGYNEEIDQLRQLYTNSNQVLQDFLDKEQAATGITNLKVGQNKVIGFYLEVSKGKVNMVPDHYIPKQTLTNSNRYITPELKDYEQQILEAEAKLQKLEVQVLQDVIYQTLEKQAELDQLANILANLDCLAGFAVLAAERNFVRPAMVAADVPLKIKDGRHPVVEQLLEAQKFIANDTNLDPNDERVRVITGPNMGGKSTYLRQTALIVLLAHMGSFVPASEAQIPLTDRIFTRVGASDNLAKGQSTFMVEMQELAVILHRATESSLLIIDEIGRGTSTFDGVSIAWATLEFIHNQIKAKTLFATHYHELIAVANSLAAAQNYCLAIHDQQGKLTFLHKVQPGGMDDSYGIEVAEIAGIPSRVVTEAKAKLAVLEDKELKTKIKSNVSEQQLDIFAHAQKRQHSPILKELDSVNINELTPLDALSLIDKWQKGTNQVAPQCNESPL